MSVFSSLTTWLSEINITMEMLIMLSLTEFLMLAIIALVYLFRKNKNLKNVIVKLKVLIRTNKSSKSQLQQVTTYMQEQIALSELQYATLSNSKDPDETTKKNIQTLSGRLMVLNSELLTLPEYIENDDSYWSNIYARYAELTPAANNSTTDGGNTAESVAAGSVETLEEIEAISEDMLLSLGESSDEYDKIEFDSISEIETDTDHSKVSTVENSGDQETPELKINDTVNEEIDRLRQIISRQFSSIDELKLSVNDIQGLSKDEDNQALSDKFTRLKQQMDTLLNEQEQFNMCINVLEQENLRLSEEILQYQSESASNHPKADNEDDVQSQAVLKGLVQTNKEQLQCISILENEIKGLRNNQNETSSDTESVDAISNDKINTTIDELKFKLSDKNSEIGLLREEYVTLKQKYVAISRKVADG